MDRQERFNELIVRIVIFLRRTQILELRGYAEELEYWLSDSSIDYRKGFLRCMSMTPTIKGCREDYEQFDVLFQSLLEF